MTFEEFLEGIVDQKTQAEMREYTNNFWNQASAEEKKKVFLALKGLSDTVLRMVSKFWAMCGILIAEGYIIVDGTTYSINPASANSMNDKEEWAKFVKRMEAPMTAQERFAQASGSGDYKVKGEDKC